MITEENYRDLRCLPQRGFVSMYDNGMLSGITTVIIHHNSEDDDAPAASGTTALPFTGHPLADTPEGMIGAYSMLDICHYSEVGTVLAIAFGTDDGAHSAWIISPGMEEPMLMESGEGLESSFIDTPICIPSDVDLAEYIATTTLAKILKAGYDSSYDRNAHRHSRRRRGTRNAK